MIINYARLAMRRKYKLINHSTINPMK